MALLKETIVRTSQSQNCAIQLSEDSAIPVQSATRQKGSRNNRNSYKLKNNSQILILAALCYMSFHLEMVKASDGKYWNLRSPKRNPLTAFY